MHTNNDLAYSITSPEQICQCCCLQLASSDPQLGDILQREKLAEAVESAFPKCRSQCPILLQHLRHQATAGHLSFETLTGLHTLIFGRVCIDPLLHYGIPVKFPIISTDSAEFDVELKEDTKYFSYCKNLLRHDASNNPHASAVDCRFRTQDESPFFSLIVEANNKSASESHFDLTQYAVHVTATDDTGNKYAEGFGCVTLFAGPVATRMIPIAAKPVINILLAKLPFNGTDVGQLFHFCVEIVSKRYQQVS